ncbi:hypothetical protein CVT24_007608 [Panaeolus cyanescens]|uniref:DUF6589 domain-containing protein n=1 Tax=Panaeolus cyanescens TaxID=181874 RepID=A0A409YKL8_9AGAR|nr:hypothetical protein CVT24_007608 [Panaeolus cyanescens]
MDFSIFIFGWLHAQMAFANSLHKQYLGTSKGRGLHQAFEALNRKGLYKTRTQGPFYHDLVEALYHIAKAHIRVDWCRIGGVSSIKDLRTLGAQSLYNLAEKIVNTHASSEALDAMDLKPELVDEQERQVVMFNRDVLQFIILDRAIRHECDARGGDGSQLIELEDDCLITNIASKAASLWHPSLEVGIRSLRSRARAAEDAAMDPKQAETLAQGPCAFGVAIESTANCGLPNKPGVQFCGELVPIKDPLQVAGMMALEIDQICDTYGEFVHHECWVVNFSGKEWSWCPVDKAQEMNIRDIKATYRSEGTNIKWAYFKKLHPAIPTIRHVIDFVEEQFKTVVRGKRHTVPSAEKDIQQLQEIHKSESSKYHDYHPGRKIKDAANKADDFTHLGFLKLQRGDVLSNWIGSRTFERSVRETWPPEAHEDPEDDEASTRGGTLNVV